MYVFLSVIKISFFTVGNPSPFLCKGEGLVGDLDFSHEKWGVGKIGSFLKREVSLIFTLTNPFYYHLSLCVLHVCLFCLDLAFLNLVSRYVTFASE